MKIVIPDHIEIDTPQRKKLEEFSDIKIYDDTINDPEVIKKRIKEAEIVTANFIDLSGEIIEQSHRLKYIISPAVGYDWIDVAKATERGIKVLNCPTFNSQAVAEHAIGLMFAVNRKTVQAHQSILRGEFQQQKFVGTEVKGKVLVTVGYGKIGKRVVEMAKGLSMETSWINTKTTSEAFDTLIAHADVLVMCLPLNDSTRGILNRRRLNSMKPSSIVINVARGLVIDQEAFYDALKKDKIAGAGIDTFAKDETITEARKDILNFAKLANVVATPHIGYNTKEAQQRLGQELIQDIESCLLNKPINLVN